MKFLSFALVAALVSLTPAAHAAGKLEGNYVIGPDCLVGAEVGSPVVVRENEPDSSDYTRPRTYLASYVAVEIHHGQDKGLLDLFEFLLGDVTSQDNQGTTYLSHAAYSADGLTLTQVAHEKSSAGVKWVSTTILTKTAQGLEVRVQQPGDPEAKCSLPARR